MSWIYLILAIGFEVLGTLFLKISNGFANIKYMVFMLIAYILSLVMMSVSLKKIDIGTAYAVWSGLGITAVQIIGILFFKEAFNWQKLLFIILILIGTIGLNFSRTA